MSKTNDPAEAAQSTRDMVREDIPQVMALEQEIFTDAWSSSDFTDHLGIEGQFNEVVMLGETLVGYACSVVLGPEMHITNIAVAAEHRRKSVARRLLESILNRAKQSGCEYVVLEVRPTNEEALAFYDRFGFDQHHRSPDYYHSPVEDALVLVRYLDVEK